MNEILIWVSLLRKESDMGCGSVKKQNTSTYRKQEQNTFASKNKLESTRVP